MGEPIIRVIVIVDEVAYELLDAEPTVAIGAFGWEPPRHGPSGDLVASPRAPYLAPTRVDWRNNGQLVEVVP